MFLTEPILNFLNKKLIGSKARARLFFKGFVPLLKKIVLYNRKYPFAETITRFDEEDPNFVDSIYDNIIAPLLEELAFTLVPMLIFPNSLAAIICFRIVFLLIHLIEKDHYGKIAIKGLSIQKLLIPFLISVFAILSKNFVVSLFAHIVMNAFVTPLINKFSSINFIKASLPQFYAGKK